MSNRERHFRPGHIYHVLNRGALRQTLFSSEAAYDDFDSLICESLLNVPLPILTYTLMPNHWHFAVRPNTKEELSEFFQYLASTHAKRFRARTFSRGDGHVYQDRFKSFPVEGDGHFLCVCRYIERNALRAHLVLRAEDWRWCGLWQRLNGCDEHLTSNWPVARPENWVERVNQPLTQGELNGIRKSVRRGTPFGNAEWVEQTARNLGLEHSLRALGRPRILAR